MPYINRQLHHNISLVYALTTQFLIFLRIYSGTCLMKPGISYQKHLNLTISCQSLYNIIFVFPDMKDHRSWEIALFSVGFIQVSLHTWERMERVGGVGRRSLNIKTASYQYMNTYDKDGLLTVLSLWREILIQSSTVIARSNITWFCKRKCGEHGEI